jgi:UDP-N-acetyl-D-galactosamine dehydrogenase
MIQDLKLCVLGLGYVGLPLAVAFGKTDYKIFGFDIQAKKFEELKAGVDSMGEIAPEDLKATKIEYSADPTILAQANFIVVAVPTPIDQAKRPDLSMLEGASEMIGKHLKPGTTVVFESTVYPGVTEDVCQPIIEKFSSLKCGVDWKIGYSPERINPGDKEHTLEKIVKVVSGMDTESLEHISEVYGLVCLAGVHKAPTIKTAEAAKVIENIQRDLNIALANELSLIFRRLGLNTFDVLKAAGTKWNFHKYQPGLVGGHCIGVDPYYLTHRAEELGYHPEVILAGRRINDSMADHVAQLMIRGLTRAGKAVKGAKVLVMGLTFKENVNDCRNSKVKDVIQGLKEYEVEVVGFDPILEKELIQRAFGVPALSSLEEAGPYDGIVFAVPHKAFDSPSLSDLQKYLKSPGVLVDVKGVYRKEKRPEALIYECL